MSSELKVNSIRDTSNNEAITISSGNVSFNNTISAGTIGSGVSLSGGYLSGSKFDVVFYEAGSASSGTEVWYKVPTECQLVDFRISAYHSSSHNALAYVYTSTQAGSSTSQVWYREKASTSGWETWETGDANSESLPVNLGGSGEHTFVGVRTTSGVDHPRWTLVTTTLTFQVD